MEAARKEPSLLRGYLFILTGVLFWGGSASLAKFLFTTSYDVLIIVQTRSSIPFFIFALYFLWRDRSVFKIRLADLYKFVLIGVVGISVTNFAYYFTVKESTVASAILIQYAAPVLVMVYAVYIGKTETLNGIKVISLCLAMIGCFLAVTGGSLSSIQLKGWGLVSGITSAFCYAFMLLMSKHLLRSYSVWTMLLYGFGFALLFWLFINPPSDIIAQQYTWKDWGTFLFFAIISILIPHTFFSLGMKLLEATTVGIVTTLEPVLAMVIAHLTIGEALGSSQIAGGIAVVSAIIVLQLRRPAVAGRWNHAR